MINKSLLCIAWCFLALCAVVHGADEKIAYERETLQNGLQVIYAPMRESPVVHVRVVYHVGSRDESPERHGFAHLFEHMMFRGSEHVGTDEHVRLIRAAGGTYNGSTSQDATSYFQTLPRNQLPLALYLEADRMASFHVTDPIFRIERKVVLEELNLRDLNPEAMSIEDLVSEVFRTSAYHWTPDGDPEQLRKADVGELQLFFDRFYKPNNATLVISGDFDIAQARQMVRDYFDWIARGPAVSRNTTLEPLQTQPRRIEMDRAVPNRIFLVGCRIPRPGTDDDAAITYLEQAIAGRVMRYLSQPTRPLCSSTFSRVMQFEQDGMLCFGGELLPGTDLEEVERIIQIRLQLLREEGVQLSEMDFSGIADQLCSRVQYRRMSADGVAAELGWGAVICGDPDAQAQLIRRLRELTAPKFREVAERILKPEGLTYLIVRPKGVAVVPGVAEVANAAVPPEHRPIGFPTAYPTTAPFSEQVVVNPFDRVKEFRVQGCRVMLVPEFKPNTIEMRLILPRGWHDDPAGKEGLGALTIRALITTTYVADHDPVMGLSRHAPFGYGLHHEPESTEIDVTAPMADADYLMQEFNYGLREELEVGALDRFLIGWKRGILNNERARNDLMDDVAEKELRLAIFAGTAFGRESTAESLRPITSGDLEACRRRLFDFSNATILLGGNISAERARALVEKMLDGWTPADPKELADRPDQATVAEKPSPARARPRIILVDARGSQQSLIRIGSRAFGWGDPRFPSSELGEWILSQRIWRHIRDEKGYAYVVNTGFQQYRGAGLFSARTETSFDGTGATLAMLLKDISQMSKEPVTSQELADAKSAYAGGMVTGLQMPQQQALWCAQALLSGEAADVPERIQHVQPVNVSAIQQLFADLVKPGQLTVVVVAPAALVREQLQSLGDVEIRRMPNQRPGASTRPVYEELPLPL